jgi:uncharacterized phiE125 gp8 family phage protein
MATPAYLSLSKTIEALGLASYSFNMWLTGTSGTFAVGDTITGASSGATVILNRSLDTVSALKRYEVVLPDIEFTIGETITSTSGGSGTLRIIETNILNDFIVRAEKIIEQETRRKWNTTTEEQTDVFTTHREQTSLWLTRTPVNAVTAVTVNNDTWDTVVEGTDFYLDQDSGKFSVWRGKIDPTIPAPHVEITYTWGTTGIPEDLKQCVALVTQQLWRNYVGFQQSKGADELVAGDFRVKFEPRDIIPEEAKRIIKNLRHASYSAS